MTNLNLRRLTNLAIQGLIGLLACTTVAAESPLGQTPLCHDSAGAQRDCAVLIIHSYHPALEWSRALSQGFAAAFNGIDHIRIDTEYLDAKRRPDLAHADTFLQLLRVKYRHQLPDVVVISDDPAFELIWSASRVLFPDVPVVFMGLNGERRELTDGTPGVTGIFERHETERTVALALELTGAEGIVVITDTSETGLANEATIERLITNHPDVTWQIERDLPATQLSRLARVPQHWPVIPMLPLRERNSDGPMLAHSQSVALLRAALPNPLFYDVEWLMGNGIVGGYNLSGMEHGSQAGELALAILSGTNPEALPYRTETAHRWIFDARELQRFGWQPDALPNTAEFWFSESGYWETHRDVLIPSALALTLAALLILALGITVARQRRSEHRLSAALAASDAGVFEIAGDRTYASQRWLALLGAPNDIQLPIEAWVDRITPASREAFNAALNALRHDASRQRLEIEVASDPARTLDVLMTRDERNAIVGVATDVTARRQLEQEVTRRHRLQALGELSGGIAHDFNNLLTIVNCNAELIQELTAESSTRKSATEISEAGTRAADLTAQLLTFGRPDTRGSELIDINSSIRNTHRLLQRLISPNHEVVTILHDEPLQVALGSAHIEQVLSNLVLNARDAMPSGGTVYVETSKKKIDGHQTAVLTVRDAGVGIDQATAQRIYEPFFTTKNVGEGSGLGLSTVYGIVSSSEGAISFAANVDGGTTFTIRWPVTDKPMPIAKAPVSAFPRKITPRQQSILLVEDEPGVGRTTQELLTMAGYEITIAKDGREGLSLFAEDPDRFDLILSDIVLPHMDGTAMVRRISEIRPDVRVGFVSGYDQHRSSTTHLPADADLLSKPFSRRELYEYVDRRLGDAVMTA